MPARKHPLKRLFLLFSFLILFQTIKAGPSFVHRDGRQLKDSLGNVCTLHGMNLGGWLLWEGWMWGDGFKSQSKLMRKFTDLVGENEAQKFRDTLFRVWMKEADIRAIHNAGFNVVRIPFNHRIFQFRNDSILPSSQGWSLLDSAVSWCRRNGLYAVLDMHAAPGGQSVFFIADHTKGKLVWKSEASCLRTIALWQAIAEHFKDNTTVAGYDLLNEPVPPRDQLLVKLYQRIIVAIRARDKNHLLFLEGGNFAKRFRAFKILPDSNISFSFHIYTWLGGNPVKKVRTYARLSKRLDVPVWCGEWGENKYELIRKTRQALDDPLNGFCGWAYWSWKRMHTRFPNINVVEQGEHWKKLAGWLRYPDQAHKPDKTEALMAMKELLTASDYSVLVHDAEMMKALTSKP
ncbi:MAG: glycoside hydrolase family 5 protein [Bacteroidia bacterium]